MFDKRFVITGVFPKELSKALHRAFDYRQMGDYRELLQVDRNQAVETLHAAEQFVKDIEKYFQK